MPLYVADTHALLWYLGGSPMLGVAARAAFDDAANGTTQVSVPAIALAELVSLAEKRRGAIDLTRIVAILRSAAGFRLTSLSPEIALRTRSLTALPDIHDRLIVAEALETNATLITRDQLITASGLAPTVW
ncbi:MAG: PIN domain-containing protein [Chloroflexota bacterium]|nr:PIN domain-containing protein [Chloroflexota bacterium]